MGWSPPVAVSVVPVPMVPESVELRLDEGLVGVGGCETQLGGAERFAAARMKSELGTAPVVASEDHTH